MSENDDPRDLDAPLVVDHGAVRERAMNAIAESRADVPAIYGRLCRRGTTSGHVWHVMGQA
jgi:hypothetical protein